MLVNGSWLQESCGSWHAKLCLQAGCSPTLKNSREQNKLPWLHTWSCQALISKKWTIGNIARTDRIVIPNGWVGLAPLGSSEMLRFLVYYVIWESLKIQEKAERAVKSVVNVWYCVVSNSSKPTYLFVNQALPFVFMPVWFIMSQHSELIKPFCRLSCRWCCDNLAISYSRKNILYSSPSGPFYTAQSMPSTLLLFFSV